MHEVRDLVGRVARLLSKLLGGVLSLFGSRLGVLLDIVYSLINSLLAFAGLALHYALVELLGFLLSRHGVQR